MVLTTLPQHTLLDLQPWVGQRSCTFKFDWINGITGEVLGQLNPIRNATLSHDTTRVIKRQLQLNLGVEDAEAVNPLADRVLVSMQLGDGSTWPLGRYMFTDMTKVVFTSGELASVTLNDEMFLVDQQITVGYDGFGKSALTIYEDQLADLPITFNIEQSGVSTMSQSWTIGTNRGSLLDAVAVAGDYFSPWFANDGQMHVIRTFNPANEIPQFDWDSGNQVMRDGITETSNILTAPNRFIVVSNTSAAKQSVVGIADVPVTAPNSFLNRGFYITNVTTLQLTDANQAQSVANGLANRLTVFETASVTTAPDPRHDSYDVIFWRGSSWLELGWNMSLIEGGRMTHTIRKAYSGG
jgi:hypothetical protein